FHQGVVMGKESDTVGGEQVFQLEAIDAGSIGLLDIVMIVIIVELIDDAYAEGVGVGEAAIVDTGYVEVFGIAEVAFRLEYGIHLDQAIPDKIPVTHVIESCLP